MTLTRNTNNRLHLVYIFILTTALMFFMGAFVVTAHASTGDDSADNEAAADFSILALPATATNESMRVHASWLDDEMLRIDVTDLTTGAVSSLAIRLRDFVADAGNSRFILIQAVDLDGNLSGVIQIANPFYVPAPEAEPGTETEPEIIVSEPSEPTEPTDLTEAEEEPPYTEPTEPPFTGLTPDGSGTVVDNVTNQNGVEFFTVFTEEGNEFFLVVDRQRGTDNVYLLNAVTEADLMALAQRSGSPIDSPAISQIPPIEELLPPAPDPEPSQTQDTPEQQGEDEPQERSRTSNSNLILILVIVVGAGGAAYYIKVVKPKKETTYDDEDDEYGYDDAVSEGGDEDDADDVNSDDYDSDDGGDER